MGTTESEPYQYDVFINHRGPDVKDTFGGHLFDKLKSLGCRPFLDTEIRHGIHVLKSINEALQGARVHVAIFSKGYAESEHCLDELVDMLESRRYILPVFYHVKPKDLRWIEGGPFDEGFRKLSERVRGEQIEKWKEALFEISNYMGFVLDEVNRNEVKMMNNISVEVKEILDRDPITISRAQPNVSPTRLRRDVLLEQDGHLHGERENRPSTLGDVGSVENREIRVQETRDRRLNILVLGDPESVRAIISYVCGSGWSLTPVKDCLELTENSNSVSQICLYGDTKEIYKDNFGVITSFVEAKNGKLHRIKQDAFRACEENQSNSGKWSACNPRLHMVWFVCKKISDLPDSLKWPEITKLYDLPVQILVIQDSRTMQYFEAIFERGRNFFPQAENSEELKELIVAVDLKDEDKMEKLWDECWDAKTRAEIYVVAKIITEIRKKLGSKGKSFPVGIGSGGIITKDVSLRRSGEFVLNFLCTYWNIPKDSILKVLTKTTFKQPPAKHISIKPFQFVEFCLTVAGIILYDARASTGEPSPGQFPETNLYLDISGNPGCYDKMRLKNIRGFLQSIFEGKGSILYEPSIDETNLSWHKWLKASLLIVWRARASRSSRVFSHQCVPK